MRYPSAAALFLILALGGCSEKDAPPGSVAKPSLHAIMKSMVTPYSTAAWNVTEAMSDPNSPEGKAHAAEAADDWRKMREGALALSQTANLLVAEGLETVAPGEKIAGEGEAANLTAAEIEKTIAANRAAFVAHANKLQEVSLQIVAAADAKNVDAAYEAGGNLQEACEACHKVFWYPEPESAPKP